MRTVERQEFEAAMVELNAIPDGFKLNGTFMQTKWFVGDKEVGRQSEDGFGIIFEIFV